ncbi:MAG: hypothetical protein H8F28_26770 [Fibrella sp.]|nr:hypothetical protein [Armatimonadota bacterium]
MNTPEPISQAIVCPNCGRKETNPNIRLCPNCGATFPGASPIPLELPTDGGGQAQAQAVRPAASNASAEPRQPWAVTPNTSSRSMHDTQQRQRPGAKSAGCTTALLWTFGGLLLVGLLLFLGLLALCGVITI